MINQRKSSAGTYVTLALILFVCLFFWRYNQRAPVPELTRDDVIEEMRQRAMQAVSSAKTDYDIILDASPESVESVELILSQIHERHQQNSYSDKELTNEALKWGAYLGEVIKTQKTGEWAHDSEIGGTASLPLQYEDKGESFPVRWCYKRIVNGDEDNVWVKFLFVTGKLGSFSKDQVSE